MDYIIKRSRRKTLALAVLSNGSLEVRAPLGLSRQMIDAFLKEKKDWIAKKQAAALIRAEEQASFSVRPGDTLRLLGRDVPVALSTDGRARFDGTRFLLPDAPFQQNKPLLIQIYRSLARDAVTQAIARFSPEMGVAPSTVRITGATTRWGSCSSQGSVNFSWRLILAARESLEYVVVHELAHLTQMNHSPLFWALVAAALPDYPARRAMLRETQTRLEREGW